jgi:protein-S-isoprenylcysteine O-methyltransferase Ste14
VREMKLDTNDNVPAILNVFAGLIVLFISFTVELRFQVPRETAKGLGLFIVATGMFLVIWAATYLKGAFLGEVEPRGDVLVREGPFVLVRHPVYLGMVIALLGAVIVLRSWPGLLGVFLLFLPSEIYRAKLEEKALARRLGAEWHDYAASKGFILPMVGKWKRTPGMNG